MITKSNMDTSKCDAFRAEGTRLLESGDHKAAVEHLKQANPNDPFHKLLLARGLERLGDHENAQKAYREVVESNNNGLERALAYPEAKKKLPKS